MKSIWLVLILAPLLCAGCAQRYVMTLNNGARITTKGKPKLTGGTYIYKDLQNQEGRMPSGRVTEIAPASMVKESKETLPMGKPKTGR